MPVFTEAGPGRKKCPTCSNYTGVRVKVCPACSYEFEAGALAAQNESTEVAKSAFHDEPGKARKQCPKCEKYSHARALTCGNCGNTDWQTGKTVAVKDAAAATANAFYDEGGRARKQCSNCQKFSHARALKCGNCGNCFQKAEEPVQQVVGKLVTPEAEVPLPVSEQFARGELLNPNAETTHGAGVVLTPSGKCPAVLAATDHESVEAWKLAIVEAFTARRQMIALEAVVYWVRDFFQPHTQEYRDVVGILKN